MVRKPDSFWPHFAFSLGPRGGGVEIIYPLKVSPFISRINFSISYVNISLMTRGNSSTISYPTTQNILKFISNDFLYIFFSLQTNLSILILIRGNRFSFNFNRARCFGPDPGFDYGAATTPPWQGEGAQGPLRGPLATTSSIQTSCQMRDWGGGSVGVH